jgi:hypothetical protein
MAWKEVLSSGGQSAIEYLMPDLAADMDPTKEISGIPGMELHAKGSDSDKHMRALDIFFDVPMLDEENGNVALFFEQQHEGVAEFSLRVFESYIRLREKRRVKTTGFVIYTGDSPDVDSYFEACYGFEVSVKFRTFHLPSKSADELRNDPRPFGKVMLAGRLSLEAGDDPELREKYAWEILNATNEQGYDKGQILFILDFARRIFRLNDPQVSQVLKEAYKMQTIPLSEYSQQIKLEIAREEGIDEGIEKGIKMAMEMNVFEMVRKMFERGMALSDIAEITGVPMDKIQAWTGR